MPHNFTPKHQGLKGGDIASKVQRKNKQEVYAPSNVAIPHAEDDFREGGKAMKPLIIENCTLLNLIILLNDIVTLHDFITTSEDSFLRLKPFSRTVC
jgi:hypothetical protein